MMDQNKNEDEKPQVFSVTNTQSGWQINRREFISLGTGAAAALAMSGCNSPEPEVLPTSMPQELVDACSEINSHDSMIWSLLFHPNSQLLISGAYNDIKVWSIPDGQLLKTLQTENSRNEVLVLIDDGSILLSGSSQDRTIRFWSFEDESLINTIDTDSPVRSISIDSDNKVMLTSGGNLWALPDVGLIKTIHASDILAIHPKGNQMASFNSEKVLIHSLPDGELLTELSGHETFITDIMYSPDGTALVSRDFDGAIIVWNLLDYSLKQKLIEKSSSAFALSSDGKSIVISFESKQVSLYSFPEGEKILDFENSPTELTELAISSDGLYLAGGGHQGRIHLWSLQSGIFIGCPMDLSAMAENKTKATVYQIEEANGIAASYTVPCGSVIPAEAVCTCNCVAGDGECVCVGHSACNCVGHSFGNCTCNSYSSGSTHYWHPN
jgi:WD40 repeat protein